MEPETTTARPTVRNFGPPSRQTERMTRRLRRTWFPLARGWRMTPRGIRMLQRITDPTDRVPVMRGTLVEPTTLGGVRGEWVRGPRAREAPDGSPVVLYLHGGGYVFGSPRTHRNIVSRISHVTGLPAFSADYRLPPAWKLPAPVEDALAVYRALLEDHDPSRIVVAGDSAGGNLTHALALRLAEAGLPRPAALVLLSPWADLAVAGSSISSNGGHDTFIPETALRRCARVAADGVPLDDWHVSPLYAPDELQRQLPPTLIQVGAREVLYDDGVRVADVLARCGVRTELDVFAGTLHVAVAWLGTPEAREALYRIAAFVHAALPADAPKLAVRGSAAVDAATDESAAGANGGAPGVPGVAP
ncbi:MAG: alpha/beta hydrolase [Patulibacter sp.]|nr:alpha/beta hydrolase [Patulibacter sp.]